MERIFDVITDRRGNALASAQVTVKTEAGSLATIFSDDGVTTATNPTFTNADGEFTFFVANGKFTTEVVATGYSTEIVNHKVAFDPADLEFPELADVFSSYVGLGGLTVRVNAAETGLTAVTVSVGSAFTALADTFSSYSGKGGHSLRVNDGATGVTAVPSGRMAVEQVATATYTAVAADAGKWKVVNFASTVTYNINTATAFSFGDSFVIKQKGVGQVVLAAAAGITLEASDAAKTREQYAAIGLTYETTNVWSVFGDTAAS